MDTSRYARFLRPGHRLTGDRSQPGRNWMQPATRVGYDYAHASSTPTRKQRPSPAFGERALVFFGENGIVAERPMNDNGFSYVKNRSLRELLTKRGIGHLTTEPYRPRTNGKVERFHQTLAHESAYGLNYATHRHRAAALPPWLDHYNTRRPHSSNGDRPPISRVHNVRG